MCACIYGIDRWMPPKLVDRLTAKLVNRLTANLVLVNLVHFTFNHICHLSSEPHICSSPSRK